MRMVERIWADWSSPLLPAAAAQLVRDLTRGRECDGRSALAVVPGRRAARLLRAFMLETCRERGLFLAPPRLVTPGPLLAALGPPTEAVASPLEQRLAWMKSLGRTEKHTLRSLMPGPADEAPPEVWHRLAVRLMAMHEELAGAERSFLDAARLADSLGADREGDRWRALHAIHADQAAILRGCGLRDPHEALRARESREPADGRIEQLFLIGTIDLNAAQRRAVESFPGRAVAIIHAPPGLADAFDDLGCIRTEAWLDRAIHVDDDQLRVCERPPDQAQAALDALASMDGRWSAEDIVIGLGDEALAGDIERAAAWAGVQVRAAAKGPLSLSPAGRLLRAIADWLEDERFAAFAALVRHPDLEERISTGAGSAAESTSGACSWLGLLDQFFSDCLCERLSATWLDASSARRPLRRVYEQVRGLLAPLRGPPRSLGAWAGPMLKTLRDIYGPRSREAFAALEEPIEALAGAVPALQPTVSASESIRLLLREVEALPEPREFAAGAIEMLGWLELPTDPAPTVILTGFNDGSVPQAVTSDLFLPDSFRRRLGLMNNDQRLARDSYILEALLRGRERVVVICGRCGANGEPVHPSRLLLRCGGRALAERVRRLSAAGPSAGRAAPRGVVGTEAGVASRFRVPPLPLSQPFVPPASMRVTDFKLFLECPYRYALRRLLGLERVDDDRLEMDALAFGCLAHEVLAAFAANEPLRDCIEPGEIDAFLSAELDRRAEARFGAEPLVAVRVQLAGLQQRLREFARLQATERAAGWRIEHYEMALGASAALQIDGAEPMPLRGTIDRIDRHVENGRWRVIDYKTSESGESPLQTHCGCRRLPPEGPLMWVDLQLPLYHYLARRSGIGLDGEIELAYVVLPKREHEVQLIPAPWTEAHLADAIACARDVVHCIRSGKFEMDTAYGSSFDDFARICQTTAFAKDDTTDSEQDAAERGA
jgi:hypothetical protein